jgi:membrane protease YdiL (CAAX protease family)
MTNRKQQLIIGGGYYILAILVVLFFYREKSVPSELVQTICAVLFLLTLPMLLVKKAFGKSLQEYNWPTKYVKKQLVWSIVFIWGFSLLFWGFMIQWGGEDVSKKMIWKNGQAIKVALINLTIVPVGLLAQEFFFRGFLLKILKNSFNKLFSVSVVAVLAGMFSMILAQKIFNWQVLLGILIANVFLGLIALKFRSVVFPFFIYWIIVVWLNFWALYQVGSRLGS